MNKIFYSGFVYPLIKKVSAFVILHYERAITKQDLTIKSTMCALEYESIHYPEQAKHRSNDNYALAVDDEKAGQK